MNKQYGDDRLKDQRRLEILCPERCERAKAHTHAYAGYRAETKTDRDIRACAEKKNVMDGMPMVISVGIHLWFVENLC